MSQPFRALSRLNLANFPGQLRLPSRADDHLRSAVRVRRCVPGIESVNAWSVAEGPYPGIRLRRIITVVGPNLARACIVIRTRAHLGHAVGQTWHLNLALCHRVWGRLHILMKHEADA